MSTLEARLAAIAAMPKTHIVVTTYADGRTRRFGCRSQNAANNYRASIAGKIGRDLIDRDTGATVRVISIEVEAS